MARVFKLPKSAAKDTSLLTKPYFIKPPQSSPLTKNQSHSNTQDSQDISLKPPHGTTNYNERRSWLYQWKRSSQHKLQSHQSSYERGSQSCFCSAFRSPSGCICSRVQLEARAWVTIHAKQCQNSIPQKQKWVGLGPPAGNKQHNSRCNVAPKGNASSKCSRHICCFELNKPNGEIGCA